MNQYLIGIDTGLTVTKAALFDFGGHEIAVASRRSMVSYPHPGWVERDSEALWHDVAATIREVVTASGVRAQQIAAVGATGHGNGAYLLDRQGQPLRPAILSQDSRAAAIVAGWQARDLDAQTRPRTYQSLWPAQPGALLAWLRHDEPTAYARLGKLCFAKDYVNYRLGGTIGSDYSEISTTGLFDAAAGGYRVELLELLGIGEAIHFLPDLAHSTAVVGYVTAEAARATGLTEGTPLVAGLTDIDACALGSGVIAAGQASIIAGTWSINQIVTDTPLVSPALFMTSLFAVPGLWLSTEASATSATNLEWFVAQCCGEERVLAEQHGLSVYEICNELVASLTPDASTVIFHPFLFGSNTQARARAGFYGVAGWHTKAHLLRAIYEGVAFSHRSHLERLVAAGARIASARLTGGGARSQVWSQIFADTLELPVEIPDSSEVGALGAALCAGIGVGAYHDFTDATARTVRISRHHTPDPTATPHYLARYRVYRQIAEAMAEAWERLGDLK